MASALSHGEGGLTIIKAVTSASSSASKPKDVRMERREKGMSAIIREGEGRRKLLADG